MPRKKRGNLGRLSQDAKRRRMSLSGGVSSQPSTSREPASARNETLLDDFETISNKRRRMSLSGGVSSQPSTSREPASARNETLLDDFETISNERQGSLNNFEVQESTKPGTSTANVYLFSSQSSTSRERMARFRAKQTELKRAERITRDREWHKLSRATQSQEDRDIRRNDQRVRQEQRRQMETEEEREERRKVDRVRHSLIREIETEEEREARRDDQKVRQEQQRRMETEEECEARREVDRVQRNLRRETETEEEREVRREEDRERQDMRRQVETAEEREARLLSDNERYHVGIHQRHLMLQNLSIRIETHRSEQNQDEINDRMAADAERHRVTRHLENTQERQARLEQERTRHIHRNLIQWCDKKNSGFMYDSQVNYSEAANIGDFDKVCRFCNALTWDKEPSGICCASGKVSLAPILEAPEPLRSWMSEDSPQSQNFLQNIRAYNSAFQMTSFGGNEIREGAYMPTFKIQGQVYHLIGSLLPPLGQPPSFLQIYFVGDDQVQLGRRQHLFQDLEPDMLEALQTMLQNNNAYLISFKTALESLPVDTPDFKIVIRADRCPAEEHPGRYNEPTVSEVAVLMVGDPSNHRDIILSSREQGLKRIYETHRSYDALQYPLMFCRGEDGYNFNLNHVNPITRQPTNKKTSCREFYAYRIMVREGDANHIHNFKNLFNQYLVDMYAKVESERLLYIRTHQRELRAENYIHLQDALGRNDNVEQMGQKVILPSTFTGGPRYMHSRTQDAFCYVRKFGRPDLFITMTTNPKWPEITNVITGRQTTQDRHDIVSRVFHLKLKCLMTVLTKSQIYGSVRCFMYSVEWQKRGLPHAHILIWLEDPIPPNRVDQVIFAELPDPEVDPELSDIVKNHMIHGPCGAFNVRQRRLPCMKDGHCSKRYPRPFVKETIMGDNGYPTYRRRAPEDGGHRVLIKVGNEEIPMDNRWVVPYSPVLSRTFKTHINVEYCSSVKSIKYICKYINKGSDQATFAMTNTDEIQMYQSGRYICTSEAVWRILSFPIHERFPSVTHLEVHLPDEQKVYFQPDNVRERMERGTALMAFFNLCQTDAFARTLLYNEVPSYYIYTRQRGWRRRQRGQTVPDHPDVRKDSCIGRVYTVHPNSSERYYLRLLLHSVRGPISFDDLKTVDGELHPTFQSACRALGLLEDDSCWEGTMREAAVTDSPSKLRDLFSVLVVFCNLSHPLELWTLFKDSLSEDFLRTAQQVDENVTFQNSPNLYDLSLSNIQEIVTRIGGLQLDSYGLPLPAVPANQLNIDYVRETCYDRVELNNLVTQNLPKLTEEQRVVYDHVIASTQNPTGNKIFFLDAPGGTGKTFIINLILAKVRSDSKIALATASSGIAATLLPGGRTAHSMFKIPINVDHMEFPICSISRNSPMAQVLRECSLIVWDECTMANKLSIEALDRTLRDIRQNNETMGGLTVMFSGDFRQTLPVVVRGTRADEINASMKRSVLWPIIKRLSLTVNMRVHLGNDPEVEEFADVLLKVGNGSLANDSGVIVIPQSLGTIVSSQQLLIDSVYPGVGGILNMDSGWLCDRAILAPTNEQANQLNNKVMSLFNSEERTYTSVNSVLSQDDAVHYPTEFLDSVTAPGLPAHEIILKVGAPIMLLRNLHPPKLCNGTRLRVRRLQRYVVEAEILTGCGAREVVFIPRIPLIPSNYPFQFKRLQFPISVCFAMTINKAQGQTLSTAGVELSGSGCFSHGQLYVACSRVRSSRSLFLHAPDARTPNVVYEEALR